jgi:hypothetical protein
MFHWAQDASSDMLARWTVCGHKGKTLKHPGWKKEKRRQVTQKALCASGSNEVYG